MKPILFVRFLTALSISGVSGLAPLVHADDPPRACTMDDPDLAESEPGVVSAPAIFHYNTNNYDSEIYGLAQPDPHYNERPYLICRRYEFVNTSGETIEELRWPDIRLLNISETPADTRYRIPRNILNNSKRVASAPTELYAWENIRAPSTTVFPVKETIEKKASAELGQNSIYSVEPTLFAAALDQFPDLGLSVDAAVSFYAPSKKFSYPTLQAGLVSDDLSFLIFSSATAFPENNFVEAVISVQASWKRDGEPGLFAPGIITLSSAKYGPQQTVSDRIRNFAGDLPAFSSSNTNWVLDTKLIYKYPMPSNADEPVLFVTDQPVRFSIGDWSVCVMAPVYGPVPVTLSDEKYCNIIPAG